MAKDVHARRTGMNIGTAGPGCTWTKRPNSLSSSCTISSLEASIAELFPLPGCSLLLCFKILSLKSLGLPSASKMHPIKQPKQNASKQTSKTHQSNKPGMDLEVFAPTTRVNLVSIGVHLSNIDVDTMFFEKCLERPLVLHRDRRARLECRRDLLGWCRDPIDVNAR
jgi:hypothetical protein